MIMNNFGAYRFNIARDAQGAVSLTLAAAAEEPTNPYFELNLAKLALAMRDLGKARHHLDRAQRLDVARVQAAGIAALARDIAAAAANAQPAPDATP
jgi:Tfp pilus assembly protein PilF